MNTLITDLHDILVAGSADSQETLCQLLQAKGYQDINQSKVSRLLRKVGAVKGKNAQGQIVYRLPKEPAPPTPSSPLAELVLDISCNETTIVINTSPGAAQLVARLLDYNRDSSGILGSVAGDDTILVIPSSIKQTKKTMERLKGQLFVVYS